MERPIALRTLVLLHVAPAVPLFALSLWFGAIDVPDTASRCSSCGVEGYVTVAHVVAALGLAAAVAAASAARERAAGRPGQPGPVTIAALAAAGVYLVFSLVDHRAFDPYGVAAIFAVLLAAPAVGGWWLVVSVQLARRPRERPVDGAELRGVLVRAWVSLLVLLPGLFGYVWLSRVEWVVF